MASYNNKPKRTLSMSIKFDAKINKSKKANSTSGWIE